MFILGIDITSTSEDSKAVSLVPQSIPPSFSAEDVIFPPPDSKPLCSSTATVCSSVSRSSTNLPSASLDHVNSTLSTPFSDSPSCSADTRVHTPVRLFGFIAFPDVYPPPIPCFFKSSFH
jgi:hypothetical protein